MDIDINNCNINFESLNFYFFYTIQNNNIYIFKKNTKLLNDLFITFNKLRVSKEESYISLKKGDFFHTSKGIIEIKRVFKEKVQIKYVIPEIKMKISIKLKLKEFCYLIFF
jgi:hypothetical protein